MISSTATNAAAIPRILTGTRLDPRSSTWFSVIVICTVLTVGVAGAIASFAGQMAFARWSLLVGPVAFTVPLVIDGSIIIFTLAAILQRSRGDSTFVSWAFVGLFTTVSVTANALHVLSESPETDPVRVIGGALIAGLMPVSIWLVTHVLTGLLVQRPELSAEELQAQELEKAHEHQEELVRLAMESENRRRQVELSTAQEEKESAKWAEWNRIKDLPETSQPGTPEREFFINMVEDVYNGDARGNLSEAARRLGISYKRAQYAIGNDETDTATWDPRH